MDGLAISLVVSGSGMILVGLIAALVWWRISRAQFRWFAVGIALWVVGVALKFAFAFLTNAAVIGYLKDQCPGWLYVTLGGLYVGVESCIFEIGLTFLLVLFWRAPGRDAGSATAVGTGAGAFEALLLGMAAMATGFVFAYVDSEQVIQAREATEKIQDVTAFIWLIGSVERVLAILCHMASRALVLLGVTKRRYWLVFWGFLIFTYIDSIAGAVQISGEIGKMSMWWIELAITPAAIASVFAIYWCWQRWATIDEAEPALSEQAGAQQPEDLVHEEGDTP